MVYVLWEGEFMNTMHTPKQVPNMDIYLQPLVDEMHELRVGVSYSYDTYIKSFSALKAICLWTMTDIPGNHDFINIKVPLIYPSFYELVSDEKKAITMISCKKKQVAILVGNDVFHDTFDIAWLIFGQNLWAG